MNVRLPWPDRRLSPNARVHRMERARFAREAKEDAIIATCGQLSVQQRRDLRDRETVHLAITFRPPDARKRDLDNMLASAKAALDGFAHACQVDDYRFSLSLTRGAPIKGGEIQLFIPAKHTLAGSAFSCCSCQNVPQTERPGLGVSAPAGPDQKPSVEETM